MDAAAWPLLVYALLTVALVGGLLLFSARLGPRTRGRVTDQPYESGVPVTGDARLRISAQFYLVAVLFVIFDLEAVYLFVWAVSARETGAAGLWEALVFMGVLGAALIYLWRVGALEWAPRRDRA